jgi:predicted nucleotidyltransferase
MDITPEQSALLGQLVIAVEQLSDIDAVWLSGSLASNEGDEFSDVDVHVAVDLPASEIASATWSEVARTVDAVFVRVLKASYGVVVNAVTRDGRLFDIVVHASSTLDTGVPGPVLVLKDDRGVLAGSPSRSGRSQPSPEQIVAWVEEFLRCLLLLTVVAPREEWVSAEVGCLFMLGLLKDLMLAENGDVGVGSAKRLRRRLTPEQYEALLRLPPVAAHRSSVVAFQAALTAEFLPRAQALCARLTIDYPAEFEAAVMSRVGDALQSPGLLDIHKPV